MSNFKLKYMQLCFWQICRWAEKKQTHFKNRDIISKDNECIPDIEQSVFFFICLVDVGYHHGNFTFVCELSDVKPNH